MLGCLSFYRWPETLSDTRNNKPSPKKGAKVSDTFAPLYEPIIDELCCEHTTVPAVTCHLQLFFSQILSQTPLKLAFPCHLSLSHQAIALLLNKMLVRFKLNDGLFDLIRFFSLQDFKNLVSVLFGSLDSVLIFVFIYLDVLLCISAFSQPLTAGDNVSVVKSRMSCLIRTFWGPQQLICCGQDVD